MEAIFLYFGKMILTSGVLFLYYRLFLKDRTFHHYNRFYLLVLMLVSVLLPLIKIDYFTLEVRSDIYLLLNKLQFNSTKNLHNDFPYFRIALIVFGLVSVFLLAKLFYGILKIQKFKKIYPKENFEGLNFYQTNLNTAPFSYFKNLFWKDTILIDSDLGRQILKHEMVHMEQKHSVDKLLVEVATSVFWFNPIFHIIKKEINLIHEYLADKKAIKNSDTKAFAQMLLASHFSGNILPGTSPFLSSNLKKRLKMLQKPKTKFGYAQRIFALPLLFVIAFAYLVNAKNKEIEKTNKAIATAISKLKKDTVKNKVEVTAQLVAVDDSNVLSIDQQLKNSTEKSLFLVNGEEFSRSQFLDFYRRNKDNKKMVFSYSTFNQNKRLYDEFGVLGPYGEFEKYGVFQADNFDEMKNNTQKYHKLQDKYAPEWRQYLHSLKDPKNQERLEKVKKLQDEDFKKTLKANISNDVVYAEAKNNTEKNIKSSEIGSQNFTSDKLKRKVQETVEAAKIANKTSENWMVENSFSDDKGKLNVKIKLEKKENSKSENAVDEKEFKSKAENFRNNIDINKTSATQVFVVKKDGKEPKVQYVATSKFEDKLPENVKIYVNGKLITEEEMKKIDPKTILRIDVNKKDNNGVKEGEIQVTTK